MQIPPEQIIKFQKIWKEIYNEEITEQEAIKEATTLLNFGLLALGLHPCQRFDK